MARRGACRTGRALPIFATDAVEEETPELTDHMRLVRNQRALFWLVMLNAGAVLLVMGFGSLLAWLAFIALLNLGAGPLNQLLDGRFKRPQKVMLSGLSAVGLIGLFIVGTQSESIGSGPLAIAIVLAVWVDHWLSNREDEGRTSVEASSPHCCRHSGCSGVHLL